MRRGWATLLLVATLIAQAESSASQSDSSWLQWGGPGRDFMSASTGLADRWPDTGPPVLWRRPLGEGYSGIVGDGSTLYTMYREARGVERETVVAFDPASGETRWEHRYDAPFPPGMDHAFGDGPHATPLIIGERMFTVGAGGLVHAYERHAGELIWSLDLNARYRMSGPIDRGYAASPIAYADTIILPVGGAGHAIVAIDQGDGAVRWERQDLPLSPASPLLIEVDGQQQLVMFMGAQVVGLDPAGGALLWSHEHPTSYDLNISLPVWGEDNLLFVSAAYDSGSRVLRLGHEAGRATVQELWYDRRMKVHIGNTIRLGDVIYGSSGDFGPAFLMAVDIQTGEVLGRARGLAKVTMIHADGKLILLDEDGTLALGLPRPDGVDVVSEFALFDGRSWTVPTLLGTTLFARDRSTLVALDLRE